LNAKKGGNAQGGIKVIEEMNQNIIIINELNDDLAQGTGFYNKLKEYLNNL